MQLGGRIQSLAVELEGGRAHGGGGLLHGRVRLQLRAALRLRALEVSAHGRAAVHWLESRSIGLKVVYRDYSAFETFLCRRCQLIPGILQHFPKK
ncbi:arrestin domain-containing protein 3-like protein [Willisornis vidua]|uniref:Arrestin domain-containing protein 3-like protein n=1 Tax=Willisornis vidua TaxID=1566151 RepID=A0ABQ9D2D2_9PASS|nr:arrestin domain-containing protein 3-like protein [Willisornis vidua]